MNGQKETDKESLNDIINATGRSVEKRKLKNFVTIKVSQKSHNFYIQADITQEDLMMMMTRMMMMMMMMMMMVM